MKRIILSLFMLASAASSNAACLQTPVHGEKLITSNFGFRFHPTLHVMKPHGGMDLRAPTMTKLYAATTGTIDFNNYTGPGGNTVVIAGVDGLTTKYLHLSKSMVKLGDTVNAGDFIGFSGNTGDYSAAPHLHFVVIPTPGTAAKDPRQYMCEKLAEKPGAGPELYAGSVPSPTPQPSGGPSADLPNSAPNMGGWIGKSEHEVLYSEVTRRYMNLEWHAQVASCTPDAILAGSGNSSLIEGGKLNTVDCEMFMHRELVEMNALQMLIDLKKSESKDRIEMMLATTLADKVKQSSAAELAQRRNAAARASGARVVN